MSEERYCGSCGRHKRGEFFKTNGINLVCSACHDRRVNAAQRKRRKPVKWTEKQISGFIRGVAK